MADTLANVGPVARTAMVEFSGEKLMIPSGMSISDAIQTLHNREKYLEEVVNINETFDVFPWDGAYGLDAVLARRYGWANAVPTPGFFGPTPPAMISVEIAPGKFKQVPWGAFKLPAITGTLNTQSDYKDGRVCFQLLAKVKRKDEATIASIFAELREYLKTNSIYRGQAIKMRFCDDRGMSLPMPEPKFIATDDVDEAMLIYPDAVSAAIETNLFTPIRRVHDCINNGISVKRGVLLGGTFGTGKTLAAKVASKFAVQAGVTYLYVQRADELAQAINFGRQYQSPACVIFCEDIDRAVSGERSVAMDDILNIIDGIDTKTCNIITVLTTNDLDSINKAMLRPGRLDAVIEVLPPDAEAVERLLRAYGGSAIDTSADLSAVGKELAGSIPAVIAEVVKRAKLAQLRRQQPGERVTQLSGDALLEAASTMRKQLDLLNREPEVKPITVDNLLSNLIHGVIKETADQVDEVDTKVQQLVERFS